MKVFSKFKKQIDNLFDPELKMEFCCYAYPMRSQRGSTSIPRFCIKIGKEIIWDCPKGFEITENFIHSWSDRNGICDLVRDYIDTPINELLETEFEKEKWSCESSFLNENIKINYRLTEIFKAADRRLGRIKLIKWAREIDNPLVNLIIEKRFGKFMTYKTSFQELSKLAMDQISKQQPATLEKARTQVLWLKAQSSNKNKKQEIQDLLKIYHPEWTQEQIEIEVASQIANKGIKLCAAHFKCFIEGSSEFRKCLVDLSFDPQEIYKLISAELTVIETLLDEGYGKVSDNELFEGVLAYLIVNFVGTGKLPIQLLDFAAIHYAGSYETTKKFLPALTSENN